MAQRNKNLAVPKYQRIAEHFRGQMQSGALKPGDRLPSLVEMREQYGSSRPTTDKVHSILQAEGLIQRRQGHGTFVLQPRRTATGVIGLSGPDFSFKAHSTYWSSVMSGICEAAERAAMPLMILGHESSHGWEKVDGILYSDWEGIWALRHLPPGLPHVSVLVPHEGKAGVSADDYGGARLATQHLLDLGHRHIAYLHGHENHPLMNARLAGYHDALSSAGVMADKSWARRMRGQYAMGARFSSEGRKNMMLWLRDGWRDSGFTALLCHNDEIAMGAIAALNEAGLRVPEDVSVIGFDGIFSETDTNEIAAPRLTTVAVPLREIGVAAIEILLRQIAADKVSGEQKTLPVQLHRGASCTAHQ